MFAVQAAGPSGRRLPREGRDVTCRSAPSTCPSRLPLCHSDAQEFARAATPAPCSDARAAVFRRGPRTRRAGHLPSARAGAHLRTRPRFSLISSVISVRMPHYKS